MKVITNEERIAKKKKQASFITPFAMIFLVGGLITNFLSVRGDQASPLYITVTVVLLGLGFIAATISSHLVNHWVKEPRPDQVLAKVLKGFDNRHYLFNYTSIVPHVLLTRNKVYTITPKLANGDISVNDRKWKRKFKLSRIFRIFAEEGLGNPTVEAEHDRNKLVNLIQKHIPDSETIPIEPIIIFTDPNTDLTVENPAVPAMTGNKLKKFIQQSAKGSTLNHELRQQLVQILDNQTNNQ